MQVTLSQSVMGMAVSAAADQLQSTNSQEFIVMEKIIKGGAAADEDDLVILSNSNENQS